MSNPKFLVAVPAFNCAKQISKVVEQFSKSTFNSFAELLVIDNCSTDTTLQIAINAAEKAPLKTISIIQNSQNYNLGGTHKVAFQYMTEKNYDGVVILHGDDQGRLADIEKYLDNPNIRDYDCILGARFMKNPELNGYSKIRVLGNHLFNTLYSFCTLTKVSDMGSGLNYFSEKLIKSELHSKMPDDLTFNNAFLLSIIAANKKILFFPISWREEDQISNAKLWSQSLKLLKYLSYYLINKKAYLKKDFRTSNISIYQFKRMK